jgi:hypothetical protein
MRTKASEITHLTPTPKADVEECNQSSCQQLYLVVLFSRDNIEHEQFGVRGDLSFQLQFLGILH